MIVERDTLHLAIQQTWVIVAIEVFLEGFNQTDDAEGGIMSRGKEASHLSDVIAVYRPLYSCYHPCV